MKILSGLNDHPDEARALALRVQLRRALEGPPLDVPSGGRHRIEDLGKLEFSHALEFRPRLRDDVRLTPNRLRRGPFEIEIDAFEYEALCRSDGATPVGEIAVLAQNVLDRGDTRDPIARALELFSELARFDALVPGVQHG